jgi:hypothetical protein
MKNRRIYRSGGSYPTGTSPLALEVRPGLNRNLTWQPPTGVR